MSENKNINELEFDDEIDFDGLEDIFDEEDILSEEEDVSYAKEEKYEFRELSDEEYEELYGSYVFEDIYLPESDEVIDCPVESAESEEVVVNIAENNDIDIENISFSHIEDNADDSIAEDTEKKSDTSVNRFVIVNTAISAVTLCAVAAGIIMGYGYVNSIQDELQLKSEEIAALEKENRELEDDYLQVMNTVDDSEEFTEKEAAETEKGKIIFYDTSVGYSWIPVLEGIRQNEYKKENFIVDDRGRISYVDNNESSSYFGIDVSSYQGDIDWQLVKEDGVEFAFLRIGYRGYGEEGKLCADENFIDNYVAAHDVGIDLGIYFFSQAVTVDEAVEEANYVLSLLEGRTLEYPIVFDWETVQTGDPEDIPRTEDVMPNTLTLSAIAFCETIRDAGYDAMIYTNKKLATIKYDLRQLQDYPIWLAYYDTELDYRYDFDIWQYGTGYVDGIEGEVDINVAIIR